MRASKTFILFFSVFFWVFSFVFMFILAVATMVAVAFVHYRRVHSVIPAPGFRLIAKLASLGKLRVIFEEGFDPNRKSVYCMNHTSILDGHVASASIPHAFCGLMNAWQRHIPFYGWLMTLSRGILLDRKKGDVLQQMIDAAKARRQEEMSILTFPEAHRTLDGRIRPFRRGVFFMAREAGFPVVPLAVRGLYDINHKGTYLFTPGPITVFIGKQIETDGLTDGQINLLSDSVRERIVNFVEKGEMSHSFQMDRAVNA